MEKGPCGVLDLGGLEGGTGKLAKGFTPLGPGGGGGKGFGSRRPGSMEKGGICPADGSSSMGGDWLGSLLGFLGRGPVIHY